MSDSINNKNQEYHSVFENPFVKTLTVSVLMAIFLVDMGLGLFEVFSTKASPLPSSLVLLVFAVMFIIGLVFYERKELDAKESIFGGALTGFGFSFVFITLAGGVQFAFEGGISTLGWGQVISAIAISMVAGVLMLRIISFEFKKHYY